MYVNEFVKFRNCLITLTENVPITDSIYAINYQWSNATRRLRDVLDVLVKNYLLGKLCPRALLNRLQCVLRGCKLLNDG